MQRLAIWLHCQGRPLPPPRPLPHAHRDRITVSESIIASTSAYTCHPNTRTRVRRALRRCGAPALPNRRPAASARAYTKSGWVLSVSLVAGAFRALGWQLASRRRVPCLAWKKSRAVLHQGSSSALGPGCRPGTVDVVAARRGPFRPETGEHDPPATPALRRTLLRIPLDLRRTPTNI